MEITRNVILDLLPLYLADEVSEETRALVDRYLETDPQLAALAREGADSPVREEVPAPLDKEDRMEAYREAKRAMLMRTIVIASVIGVGIAAAMTLALMAMFFLVR